MFKELIKGLWRENPVFRLALGLCPTLAVTSSAKNGLGMGLATAFVLVASNIVISLVNRIIPDKVRIPGFIVIIATFVTVVELVSHAWFLSIYEALGIFIPLIVVNCIILGRAESFASKNGVLLSMMDGIGMGLGFTAALFTIGSIRELLGNGSILGVSLLGSWYHPMLVMVLPPGAFLTIGFLLAGMNRLERKKV